MRRGRVTTRDAYLYPTSISARNDYRAAEDIFVISLLI